MAHATRRIIKEALTPEEQTLVDEYMDKTDAVVSRFCGSWVISDYSDSIKYATKAELMEAVRYNLREMYEEWAAGYAEIPACFFEYFPDECGEHALVAVRYTAAYEQADVSGAYELDGEWYYFTFTDKADYFTICDRERFLDYFNGDTEGYSEGAYNSFREVIENCAGDDGLLRELAEHFNGYVARGC